MSYEQGFRALGEGDFQAAVPLLEKAARQTGFSSDVINHSYTLALFRAGDISTLADVSFRIGTLHLRSDPSVAMDYFQRAIFAGLDAARVRLIGEIFEEWCARRFLPELKGPVLRVAHVVGSLAPDHAPAQYVKHLVASFRRHGVQSSVFTTEWSSGWFFNPASERPGTLDIDAEVNTASVDGDFMERASRVGEAIRASGFPVAFFHGTLLEQITARVAALRPAPIQINVGHGAVMDADPFDGFIHPSRSARERTRFPAHPSEWIPPVSDIEARIQMSIPVSRSEMGLGSARTISATFGDLPRICSPGYIRVLVEILRRFPGHFHLFAGSGNIRPLRGALHAEGVLSRVRFLGRMSDASPLLDAVDVYLTSFPGSEESPILEAMGAGKPVLVLNQGPDAGLDSVTELVGMEELAPRTEMEFLRAVDRVVRNAEVRERYGQAVRERFRSEFRPEGLAPRYLDFLRRSFGTDA